MPSGFCPRCASPIEIALPVEPLYSIDTVCQLVPATRNGLQKFLSRHKDNPNLHAPLYRWHRGRRCRLLTASDVRWIRSKYVTTDRFIRLMRATDSQRGQ